MYRPEEIGSRSRLELVIGAITLASVAFLLAAVIEIFSGQRALRTIKLRVQDYSIVVPGGTAPVLGTSPTDRGVLHLLDLQDLQEPRESMASRSTASRRRDWNEIPSLDLEPEPSRFSSCSLDLVYDEENLDTPIVPLVRIIPRYPPELREQEIEGMVVALISVDEKGYVYSVEIEKSAHQAFAESAATALLRWRFVPGRVNGEFVKFKARQPMRFRLFNSNGREKDYVKGLSILQ